MLPKGPYNPIKEEIKILKFWQKGKFNKPEYDPKSKKLIKNLRKDKRKPFCIINPPPNANARPHLGNMSGYSYQDLMGRFHRMKGYKTLLLPGKDHAGIQTEVVFERDVLKKQGINKMTLGREKFYKECFKYCIKCAKIARADEMRVGLSSDFDRDTFTLDPDIVNIILNTFIKLYNDKNVYKGIRCVNWCPKCLTALADIDCERLTRKTDLTYIKYPIKDSKKFIKVATTRPETMLADTAIAVNPKDKRYKDLIGKTAILPLLNREIPIITDEKIDIEFGTGALKVTPAHSYEDYEIMLRWNQKHPDKKIDYINTIWKDSKLYGPVGKYKGMSVDEARKEVLNDLKSQGLIEKIEEIEQNVTICERCKSIIEPIMSSQWFVDVEKIKIPAIKVVKERKIKIYPRFMEKRYFNWMNNLRDWPISRSLWWGYRIPAWYNGKFEEQIDENGKVIETINGKKLDRNNKNQMRVQIESPGKGWIQDNDVLDTWFSSGQWPFATLQKEGLFDIFYPTQVMETMYDILEWWVSRMIMLGIYMTKNIPFEHVYLHGMLKAPDGQKMSKSKGNVISMDDVVTKYGADTLRQFYYTAGKAGSSYNFDWERIKYCRNFLNKLWNGSKFVLNAIKNFEGIENMKETKFKFSTEEKRMLSHISTISKQITKYLEEFKFNLAIEKLQQSFWHRFCDKFIEYSKKFIYSNNEKGDGVKFVLYISLKRYLELLHPFIPFITEKIWQELPKKKTEPETIMYAKWPN